MPAIVIVGAGPGLGLSIAKKFGSKGFKVALISRDGGKLDLLAGELSQLGVETATFAADVTDRPALSAAVKGAAAKFGGIDVLEYSPLGGLTMIDPHDVTVANLQPAIEHELYGAVEAANAVLPSMLEAKTGTLLFTTGGGAIHPYPMLATVNTAQAALRNWALNLHNVVGDQGVYVGHVAINGAIAKSSPGDGIPFVDPDAIAERHWQLHELRDGFDAVL